ncbi:hypothetical protein [Aeromonas veronii]|uniref:Uncharacterized protein n=1 Tax=Aeromonas veronii TaxID=654 RepID=A0A2T4MZW0_AERVE|nr:hypothetical protein [Aeromonas veronii]PTH80111.1 hypothetical protein DAA48_16235 [Aeromonas veronii]
MNNKQTKIKDVAVLLVLMLLSITAFSFLEYPALKAGYNSNGGSSIIASILLDEVFSIISLIRDFNAENLLRFMY